MFLGGRLGADPNRGGILWSGYRSDQFVVAQGGEAIECEL